MDGFFEGDGRMDQSQLHLSGRPWNLKTQVNRGEWLNMPSDLARILLAAEGFLELGLPLLAEKELEDLNGDDRTLKEVWELRCKIYKETEQWAAMKDVAKHLLTLDRYCVEHWLDAAFATRLSEDVGAARVLLLAGLKFLPREALLHYRLACYAAQMGEFAEAKDRLRAAVEIEGDLKHAALREADLKPLWANAGI